MDTQYKDLAALSTIIIIAALFAYLFVNFNIPPFEDAAMLMRYAEHLAQGHGIVWNIGEPPVDGATDFLYMVVVSFFNLCGLPVDSAARSLSLFSHFLTIAVIYIGNRIFYKASIIPAVISSLYFAFGPGLFLSAAYFGTPFFSLLIATTWLIALQIVSGDASDKQLISFSLLSLITGLIRPEGVIIAVFMLLTLIVMMDRATSRRLLIYFTGIFLVIGGTYFIWRWNYFGHPLPNPFYKKGGGGIYWGSLQRSIINTLLLCYPFIPFFVLGFFTKKLRKLTLSLTIPILGSTIMWVLLSDEMNFGARFQYPILPLVLLAWPVIFSNLKQEFKVPGLEDFSAQTRLSVIAAFTVVLGGILIGRAAISKEITYHPDGKYDAGVMLSKYSDAGYTIATTEAGLLPLYSQWHSIDTWGLNDSWIAHNGGITEEYLDRVKPEIIMWHEYFSPITPPSPLKANSKWFKMVMKLKSYAEKNNYILAAVFGDSPYNTHYYYVSPSFPDKDKMISELRNIKYMWYSTGRHSVNYALLKPIR